MVPGRTRLAAPVVFRVHVSFQRVVLREPEKHIFMMPQGWKKATLPHVVVFVDAVISSIEDYEPKPQPI